MSSADRIPAKAANRESRSEAIVVSFRSDWYLSLRAHRFTAVIRKRVPLSVHPRWMYFHLNSPISAICARADILSVEMIDRSKAIQLSRELDLSEDQIVGYFGTLESVGCYRLGALLYPDSDVTRAQITTRVVYHPPQSFCVLSRDAKELLDRLCGFDSEVVTAMEAACK